MSVAADLRIERERAALLVVDVQEKLWAVMDATERAAVARNLGILVGAAHLLRMPVIVSEQYRKGLGPTIPEVEAAVAVPGLALHRLEKTCFSCAEAPAFDAIKDLLWTKASWIVAGMETHICVYQTARDLVARGVKVHVPADAVISRTAANRAIGLGLIERAGGVVTSTETVVFDALVRAGSEEFRAISRLVR
jgi:nicotinamidase-related amidase